MDYEKLEDGLNTRKGQSRDFYKDNIGRLRRGGVGIMGWLSSNKILTFTLIMLLILWLLFFLLPPKKEEKTQLFNSNSIPSVLSVTDGFQPIYDYYTERGVNTDQNVSGFFIVSTTNWRVGTLRFRVIDDKGRNITDTVELASTSQINFKTIKPTTYIRLEIDVTSTGVNLENISLHLSYKSRSYF